MIRRWPGLVLIVISAGWTAGACGATAGAQEYVAPVAQPKPEKPKPAQQKPATHLQPESLPNLNRSILEEANKVAKAAEDKALHSPSAPADPTEDPRYAAAYTDYAIWVLEHDRKSYEWHHTSSVIIFYVVIFLVLSGVWFSWMQFRIAHHHPVAAQRTLSTATATPAAGGSALATKEEAAMPTAMVLEKDSVTEFSASAQGIKVASSAIGVVILVISMCFFYLYLQKVYPITVMAPAQGGAAQVGP